MAAVEMRKFAKDEDFKMESEFFFVIGAEDDVEAVLDSRTNGMAVRGGVVGVVIINAGAVWDEGGEWLEEFELPMVFVAITRTTRTMFGLSPNRNSIVLSLCVQTRAYPMN